MKKIFLSLACVMAAVAFIPGASALPLFSRQTGMGCYACHFNHIPLLNAFGRSFKSAGYSLMGAQGKVEGENLSIPNTLNLGAMATLGYEKQQNTQGKWSWPSSGGELTIAYGGRIMDNTGFLADLGASGGNAATGAAKVLWLPELATNHQLGLVFDANNGQGVAHGFELLNTGAVNVQKIVIGQTHVNAYSAAQWMGTNNATTGVSLVGLNGMGFFNFTAYDVVPQALGMGATNLPLQYGRLAGTFDAAGLDIGVGVQRWMGRSNAVQFNTLQTTMLAGNYDATVIDTQAQGEVAGMPTGLYASYGIAPKSSMFGQGITPSVATPVVGNAFSAKSLNLGLDMNVGHELIALAGFRQATNGADNKSDNAFMFGVIYVIAQNVQIHATHTNNFGDHYNLAAGGAGTPIGKATTSLLAEILF